MQHGLNYNLLRRVDRQLSASLIVAHIQEAVSTRLWLERLPTDALTETVSKAHPAAPEIDVLGQSLLLGVCATAV